MPRVETSRLKSTSKLRMGFYEKIIDHVFAPMRRGRLTMHLPDGSQHIYGSGTSGVSAEIYVRHWDFFKQCVLFGDVGFGEAYVEGLWDTEDIAKVIEWMITNVKDHPTLMADEPKKSKPVNFLKLFNNFTAMIRKNTMTGSRRNIHAHYDLGNDFYELFLDRSMTYSAAYFKDERMSLEEAQYQKYEELCRKLHLEPQDHVLEIGCGWGGFAVYAAQNFGCKVTAVTISQQQFDYAAKRVEAQGLKDKIRILYQDYRKIDGRFDKICSIEMLEAVGHEYYQDYFTQCHRLLKEDGLLGLQVILSPDHRFTSFKNNIDWIQKHIFPGSLLPSFAVLLHHINKTGTLNLLDYEDLTPYYVKTLGLWHRKFNEQAQDIRQQGKDEAFIRKWNYYLCYCLAAFKTRNIYVAQMVFSRPNNLSL